ncbi:hypothetical protein D3C72_2522990 [compost metagenome]
MTMGRKFKIHETSQLCSQSGLSRVGKVLSMEGIDVSFNKCEEQTHLAIKVATYK